MLFDSKKLKRPISAAKYVVLSSYAVTCLNYLIAGILTNCINKFAILAYIISFIMFALIPVAIVDNRKGMYGKAHAVLSIFMVVAMGAFLSLPANNWWFWVSLCEGLIIMGMWWGTRGSETVIAELHK